ncbi:VC0807 family protein [Streptomyces sp. WM6378]|uniref:VC0807 family protein n=1 Tax=Streptomyces sp. WM6378 TaxID=1415557 RepID=UPI000B2DA467|nr:VC0807 family protein [Streptomyces sp. WM6378]
MRPTSSEPSSKSAATAPRRRLDPSMRAMASTLFYDIGLSVIAYFVAGLFGASNYLALLLATVVAGLRTLWVVLRQRRLDPFALFLLTLFGSGLALSFTTGDPRFVLAKDAAGSFTAGLVFVGSCVIGRPLAYYAALRFARSAGSARHDEFRSSANTSAMRARWFRVSLIWGISLLIDAGLRIAAVYLLPVGPAANVSQALMLAVYGPLTLWTVHSARKAQAAARSGARP